MKIINKENIDVPISVKSFLVTGEYDQDDMALIEYDDLYDFGTGIKKDIEKKYVQFVKDNFHAPDPAEFKKIIDTVNIVEPSS